MPIEEALINCARIWGDAIKKKDMEKPKGGGSIQQATQIGRMQDNSTEATSRSLQHKAVKS